MANRNEWTADRRLYLDKDGKVVEADDPTRATLLAAAGNTIPIEVAERLGLTGEKARLAPANKLRAGPGENKGSPMDDNEIEGQGTPEQLAQFDTLATPPVQEAPETEIAFDPAPALEAAVTEEEPPRRKGRKAD